MIRVERSLVDRPRSLASSLARRAISDAKRFFSRDPKARAQETFPFDATVYAAPNVADALARLFSGKCAYCETRLAREEIVVDHFRPPSGALDLRGEISADHYWWLAYEWTNLYPACKECSRNTPSWPGSGLGAENHKRRDGTYVWVVRWWEGGRRGVRRKRTYDRRQDADFFLATIRRSSQLGQLASHARERRAARRPTACFRDRRRGRRAPRRG